MQAKISLTPSMVKEFVNVASATTQGIYFDGTNYSAFNLATTGSATVYAIWSENSYTITFSGNDISAYQGSAALISGKSASSTLKYTAAVNLETRYTRTGYTFAGWAVRPEMDFSTISVETFIYGYGRGTENGRWCGYWSTAGKQSEGYDTCNNPEFNDLAPHEWKMHLGSGWLYGMSKCSAKTGDNNWNMNYKSQWTATYDELTSVTGDKKSCWCNKTGFQPNNSDIIYAPSNGLWVYGGTMSREVDCVWTCALYCGAIFPYESVNFRSVLISQ